MDFDKPTENLKNMAKSSKIDLKDPRIIDEFKAIQQANLEDIRRMKEGKPLLTQEEIKSRKTEFLSERNKVTGETKQSNPQQLEEAYNRMNEKEMK